jgi:hypothetical protein
MNQDSLANTGLAIGCMIVTPQAGPFDDYSSGGFAGSVKQIVDGDTAIIEDLSGRFYAVEISRLLILDLEQS